MTEAANNGQKGRTRELREGRWSEQGGGYHLRTSVLDRRLALSDKAAETAARTIVEMQQAYGFHLVAFVVMLDHVHLLGLLLGELDLAGVMNRWKTRASRELRGLPGYGAFRWQSGYFDRKVRASDDVLAIGRYIENNPVRKGLVERPGEYPFSSADARFAPQMEGRCWV